LPITKQSQLGELLCKTSLIIWDEAAMQHRHCAEAVSRCLQFLRDDDRPFGGVTMVFAGDWAQTLPVVPRGSVVWHLDESRQAKTVAKVLERNFYARCPRALRPIHLGGVPESAEQGKLLRPIAPLYEILSFLNGLQLIEYPKYILQRLSG
jgi:hypothetical protein